MSGHGDITDAIREEAAHWLIELDDDPSPAQRDAFHHWLTRDQRHQRVFAQMERLWGAAQAPQRGRRLSQALVVAGLFLVAALLGLQLPWQYWQADYRTAIGDVRSLTLADGSVAILDSNSAINVDFSQGQRHITLVRGEVLVDVRKDPLRPFVVTTPVVRAEALGTRYSVAQRDKASVVTVYESQVRVTSTGTQHSAVLTPGQRATVKDSSIVKASISVSAGPDWARQRLVFQSAPLTEVLARLQAYHPGVIRLGGGRQAAQRRFTGVLPSNDPDAAIRLLSSSMGLDATRITPWFVYLTDRAAP